MSLRGVMLAIRKSVLPWRARAEESRARDAEAERTICRAEDAADKVHAAYAAANERLHRMT